MAFLQLNSLPGKNAAQIVPLKNPAAVEGIEKKISVPCNEVAREIDAIDFHAPPRTDHHVERLMGIPFRVEINRGRREFSSQ